MVSTRVWWRMLPPTIIAAPTSEITLPKPAMSAASSGSRASRHSHQTVCQRDAPRPSSCSRRRGSSCPSAATVRPRMTGVAMITSAITIADGV